MDTKSPFANSVIIFADEFQAGRGQNIDSTIVYSFRFLWCKSGYGDVTVNNRRFHLQPGSYVIMPWKHTVSYKADSRQPFHLSSIHIIPNHDHNTPVEFIVAHGKEHRLSKNLARKNGELQLFSEIMTGEIFKRKALIHLTAYVFEAFNNNATRNELLMRMLAKCMLLELTREETAAENNAYTGEINSLQLFVKSRIHQQVSLQNLVEFSCLSASTIGRLFVKSTGLTPVQWILKIKMDEAKRLLDDTKYSSREVGERIGIKDPYYFSKLFKKKCGSTPIVYRKRS
jgi:YesN/AraC family two-component response regulator